MHPGADYDSTPYDALPDVRTDIRRVAALAGLYGGNTSPRDVLDLGCGFGRVLAQAAPFAPGRLVGIDGSTVACARARSVVASLGDRASVLHADLRTLDADDLGTFDVVLCIGTIYALTKPEQSALLDLMGRVVRPGGSVVISHYSGLMGHYRYELMRLLRDRLQPGAPRDQALAEARAWYRQFRQVLEESGPMLSRWSEAMSQDDTVLTHEMLGHGAAPMRLTDLDGALAVHGLGFASTLTTDEFAPLQNARNRAIAADVRDIGGGGYRYSLFVKPLNGTDLDFNIDRPDPVWLSGVTPVPGATGRYRRTDGAEYSIGNAHLQVLQAEIATAPRSWAELTEAMRLREGGVDQAALTAEVVGLWRMGLIEPCPKAML